MTIDIALARNADRATIMRRASKDLNPLLKLVVLTCADHRVDPAHVLGLEPSEAIVIRNPGGRVTRDVLRSLGVLSTVAAIEGIATGLEFLVLHHTDCGLSRLTPPMYANLIAEFVGANVEEVSALALADPRASVEYDARLLASMLSASSMVTGAVYDLETGLVDVVHSASVTTKS